MNNDVLLERFIVGPIATRKRGYSWRSAAGKFIWPAIWTGGKIR